MKAVGAEDDDISRRQSFREEVDLHCLHDPETAGNDISLRVRRGRSWFNEASTNLLGDPGVVIRDLPQRILTEKIGARAARVRDNQSIANNDGRKNRGTGLLPSLRDGILGCQKCVGAFHCAAQTSVGIGDRGVPVRVHHRGRGESPGGYSVRPDTVGNRPDRAFLNAFDGVMCISEL